jgi:hypothetical protein
MRLNHWYRVACLALILPVLFAAGCTGTDVLNPTTGNVRFELNVVDVPVDFRFDTARFRIRQITVRPVDAGADAVLGADAIGLMREAQTLNFDIGEPVVRFLPLGTGSYRLEAITISNINFRDLDAHPCTVPPYPAPCDLLFPPEDLLCSCDGVAAGDYIDRYRSTDNDGGVYIGDFAEPIIFHIDSGDENPLVLSFHWDQLLLAIQDAWAYLEDYQCDPVEPYCLLSFGNGFNEATFSSHASEFLSINE